MSLREYLQVANRHKLLIVVVALVAAAASFAISVHEARRYQASADVLLTYQDIPSLLTNSQNPNTAVPPDRGAATQARVAEVPSVAALALKDAGIRDRSPSSFLRDASVSADPASDILTFTVTDNHSDTAVRLANAYASAYVRRRLQLDAAPYLAASSRLAQRIAALRTAGSGNSTLLRQLTDRQDQLTALLALQTADARVVARATSARQVQPRPARAVAIGLPIGILLGLVLALLSHLLDPRTRSVVEAEQTLALPSLGWIPRSPRRFRQRVAVLESPASDYAEAIASVRTNVDLARRGHDAATLLVTPVLGRSSGVKPNVVANLGVAFARAGLNVVLVDLDLRRPSLGALFGLNPRSGVTEVLLGLSALGDALEPVSLVPVPVRRKAPLPSVEFGGSLRVLPVATPPANPTDVIATPQIGQMLEQLASEADIVLVDAPPLLEGSDAASVGARVDAIAVIVEVGNDRRDALAQARRRLSTVPATVLGCISTGRRGGESTHLPPVPRRDARTPIPHEGYSP